MIPFRFFSTPRLFLFGFVGLVLSACSGGGWSAEDERFVRLYTEILILREQYPDTTQANPRVRTAILSYGYTEASFQKRFASLTERPERFRQFLDSARARARAEGDKKNSHSR